MRNKHKQQGAVLVTSLIFLVILTLLAISSMRNTGLDEKMAGNALNQDAAFQAAEAAVRQGVSQVSAGTITATSGFPSAGAGCTATGLCAPSTTATPIWNTIFPFGQVAQSASAQTYTGTALVGVANQPQYIVELLPNVQVPSIGGTCTTGKAVGSQCQATPYRVTARGWGLAPEAQATTQATYMYF
jgi:type IV pilus assembly protein PilX